MTKMTKIVHNLRELIKSKQKIIQNVLIHPVQPCCSTKKLKLSALL